MGALVYTSLPAFTRVHALCSATSAPAAAPRTPCIATSAGRGCRCSRPRTACIATSAGRGCRYQRPRTPCIATSAARGCTWMHHHHHSSCIEALSDHANMRSLLFAFRRSGASSAQDSWALALSRLGRKDRRCPFSICAFCSNQALRFCEPGAPNRFRLSSLDASACALPAFSVGCFCEGQMPRNRP